MGKRMYWLGRAFEYRVRQYLESKGWQVTRSAQSKGPADLVALKAGETPRYIQCKRSPKANMGPDEWNAFYDAAEKAGAAPLLVRMKTEHRGIRAMRLTGRKDKHRRKQPMEVYEL